MSALFGIPGLGKVDAGLPAPQRRTRRRDSLGWLGVFVSVGVAVGGTLARYSQGAVALASAAVLAVTLALVSWTRLWLRESREPFPFSFSVGDFEQRSTGTSADAQSSIVLAWLSRDLISNLSGRVQRLSLLDSEEEESLDGSHVHISGWFGVRRSARGFRSHTAQRWQLEIVPQVRLGGKGAPAKLGQVVRYDLGEGDGSEVPPTISRDQYEGAFEQVYWSVASQVYMQIAQAVEEKIELLPPGRLRAAAYLYEADDYAASNTLDAYAAARRLYEKARELYDVTARPEPATNWRKAWRSVRESLARAAHRSRLMLAEASRRAARREVLIARAELGQARMQLSEWHLKLLCGSMPDEIYSVVPLVKQAVERLEKLPHDVEECQETLYRGRLTLAMASQFLSDEVVAKAYLQETRTRHPVPARADPEFFFVAGLNEKARLRSQRLLGQAVELGPTMERAHFHRALRSDHVWRSRPTFESDVAHRVDTEYQAVVSIDPGNLSAWANRGYMAWLLAEGGEADKWRDKALVSLEAGRQYKEVRSEAIVGELDWNLARLAAETGNFPKAYEHYSGAVSAQLGDTPFPLGEYFYENAGDALVARFQSYRKRVLGHVNKAPPDQRRLADAVLAFVHNDCGLAFEHYRARSGDEQALDWAVKAFEEAIEIGDSIVLPAYNLARLHQRQAWAGPPAQGAKPEKDLADAARLLDDVLRSEPDWMPALLAMANVQAETGAVLSTEIGELENVDEEAAGGSDDAREAESMRRSKISELKERRKSCRDELVRGLRRMLPHALFAPADQPVPGAYRIDAEGSDVADLVADETIQWQEEFSQFQVLALIEWAYALAAEPETAKPAYELCALLRRIYYRNHEKLLAAHRQAALVLLGDETTSVGTPADAHDVVLECEQLLRDGVSRVLTDDPAHHGVLSGIVFDWLPEKEQRDLLLKAREAQPSPLTLLSIGNRLQDMGESREARRVLALAAEDGGVEVAPAALLRLGELHEERGKTDKAIASYREAASFDNPEVAPEAAVRAMRMLAAEDQRDEALLLCESVAKDRPETAVNLAGRLEAEGVWDDAARIVYTTIVAAEPEDGDAVAVASLGLARLLDPDDPKVEPALRAAMRSSDVATRTDAQIRLATRLAASAETAEEAKELLRTSLESSWPEARERSALILAGLLHKSGEDAEALPLFELAIEEGSSNTAAMAALHLSEILDDRGEDENAREVRAKAARRHSWVALSLAREMRSREALDEAEELSRLGAEHDGPDGLFAPDCRLFLAELLSERDKGKEAEQAYRLVLDSNDGTVIPTALAKLAELYEASGRRAKDAYRDAIGRLDEFAALSLSRDLSPGLEERGETELLEVLSIAAAERGSWSAIQIGDRLVELGNAELATEVYERAAKPGASFELEGILRLAGHVAEQEPERAEALFREVVERGATDAVAAAEAGLAELRASVEVAA